MRIESCSTTVPLVLKLFPLGILETFVLSREPDDLFHQFWAATIEINSASSIDRKERQTWHWALTEQNPFNVGGNDAKSAFLQILPGTALTISNKAKMILKICKNVREKNNNHFTFGVWMTSIIISVQIVCEYCHMIVCWLFFECFTVSSRSQNKCVSLPTFHPSSLFQQQAMHTLVYESRLCQKKLESLSSTFQRWRRKVFVARSTQEKKKITFKPPAQKLLSL